MTVNNAVTGTAGQAGVGVMTNDPQSHSLAKFPAVILIALSSDRRQEKDRCVDLLRVFCVMVAE
jgi:hypothetical protein